MFIPHSHAMRGRQEASFRHTQVSRITRIGGDVRFDTVLQEATHMYTNHLSTHKSGTKLDQRSPDCLQRSPVIISLANPALFASAFPVTASIDEPWPLSRSNAADSLPAFSTLDAQRIASLSKGNQVNREPAA